jgi:hypothetical protein
MVPVSIDCAKQANQLAQKLATFALHASATVHLDRILALAPEKMADRIATRPDPHPAQCLKICWAETHPT